MRANRRPRVDLLFPFEPSSALGPAPGVSRISVPRIRSVLKPNAPSRGELMGAGLAVVTGAVNRPSTWASGFQVTEARRATLGLGRRGWGSS